MRRKKVLIVDDEEAIVLGLQRVLYKDNDNYDVVLAKNAEIATQVLQSDHIDVMVTDMRMPGQSGLDLLTWASTESPHTRALVMTAYDTGDVEGRAYCFGCLRIVQKPFDLLAMRDMIRAALEPENGVAGSVRELSLPDVIQMLCLGQKSVALRVVDGDDHGIVHIDRGNVVHALWNDAVGEDAFNLLVIQQGGTFNTLPLPHDAPRSIERNWQHLMLDAMRLKDEIESGRMPPPRPTTKREIPAPPKPAPTSIPEAPPPRPQTPENAGHRWSSAVARQSDVPGNRDSETAGLIEQGFDALRAGRLDEARRRWECVLELDPDNRVVELNLRKLEKLEQRRAS